MKFTPSTVGIDKNWLLDGFLGVLLGIGFIIMNSAQPAVSIGTPATLIGGFSFSAISFLALADTIAKFIVIVGVASVFEEFLFRDVVYAFLKDHVFNKLGNLMSVILALLLQAVAFGVFHFAVYGGTLQSAQGTMFGAMIAGVLFGLLRIMTKSNIGNIIAHAMFNAYLTINLAIII